jgi:hypothetical protein
LRRKLVRRKWLATPTAGVVVVDIEKFLKEF